MNTRDKRPLYKRYLFWLYKTTKGELDKVDRKFTQLDIDRKIEKILSGKKGISAPLKEWKDYILNKESGALKSKFSSDGSLDAGYQFLCLKLEAVEAITKKMFGGRTLAEFKRLCEDVAMSLIAQDSSERR
ncbi:MAG: hypothetical protein AUJ74_07210 [Candidatus Omnitrophica bacterium CG1_02_44_16]|nr:MAG: hypothetical protein AUJ74_07210 [Candidatus Omnitrophica bacterium CG1_02_44_16]PIY82279.1 MAG: hypothetical protein COY78_07535 [Candidatus Omnitrophica bacterium CG_4_10_14_0_8_um_filter_44_12]